MSGLRSPRRCWDELRGAVAPPSLEGFSRPPPSTTRPSLRIGQSARIPPFLQASGFLRKRRCPDLAPTVLELAGVEIPTHVHTTEGGPNAMAPLHRSDPHRSFDDSSRESSSLRLHGERRNAHRLTKPR